MLETSHTITRTKSVLVKQHHYFSDLCFIGTEVITVCQEMFVVDYFHELYTTRDNKNREDMGVVASKHHVDSWIDYAVVVSLLQARFFCPKPTRSTIFKCRFFCHWFMSNNSHWGLLKLEVGVKIVVIRENLNSRIL